MTTAFLLGAGFSKWAADVPVAKQLFDFQISATARDGPKLELVRALKLEWDALHPDAHAEQFISHVFDRGLQPHRAALGWYIARRLNEPFLWQQRYAETVRRRTLSIDETYKKHLPGIQAARGFLRAHGVEQAVGIITTNYDLLVEYALGSSGFHYGLKGERLHGPSAHPMRQTPIELTGDVPLAKLHGSISWDSRTRYSDGRRALAGQPLIVAPVPEKTPPAELQRVWDLAAQILTHATRVIVFGFAFNPYDEAVLKLLGVSGRSVKGVDLIDVVPPFERASSVWPEAPVRAFLPPPAASPGDLIRHAI